MAEVVADVKPAVKPEIAPDIEIKPPVVVENNDEDIVVKMALCRRSPTTGKMVCEAEGFQAVYKKAQIGPSSVSLRYPV